MPSVPSVEVRKTCVVTHDHDLMRKRDGEQGNEEGEVKHGKVSGRNALEVGWSDYWV